MGIIVEWTKPVDPGTEYIDIDLDDLRNGTEPPVLMQTTVLPPSGDGDESIYEVKVRVERKNDGRIDLVVEYDEDNNPHLDLEIGYWGNNRIILEQGQDHGSYHWRGNDSHEIRSEDSDQYGWRKEELREEKYRKCYLQIERNKRFRSKIINRDKKCAISGETTEKTLDAAHIIPIKEGGKDEPGNGIALRIDIHRLYDAGTFLIHPESGRPVINDESSDQLSVKYKKLLKESKGLPRRTLERVRRALAEVWPGDRSRV